MQTPMQRLTIAMSEPQYRWMQREAKRLGIGIAELLRRIVDEKRAATAS